MTHDPDQILAKQERYQTYLPVLIFIILIFILEVFQIQKATSLVISVFISFFIYGIMTANLKETYGKQAEFKPLNLFLGLLTIMMLIVIGVAILHWFQLVHVNIRWILFFIALLMYFIILFRAVHTLHHLKQSFRGKEIKKPNK
jgi:hypothetical protein